MTQDNINDTVDTQDESHSDSPVIQTLRQKVRELEGQVKSQPDRDAIEAEIRSQLEREKAIESELTALGHPLGMSAVVASKLGEGQVTHDSVADALRAIGYQIQDESDGGAGEDEVQTDQGALATVTDLSRQVSSAASGTQAPTIEQRLAGAKSRGEIAEIMAEVDGGTADYTTL